MARVKGKYVFTWKIENFSSCGLEHKEKLISPIFKAENLAESRWFLSLYPKGNDDKNFISLFLHKVKDDNNGAIDFCLELIDYDETILTSKNSENKVINENGLGYRQFFSVNEITDMMKNWNYTLTIRCHITGDSILKNNNPISESIAWTKIGVDRCSFKWKVGMPGSSSWKKKRDVFISEKSHLSVTLASPTDNIYIGICNMDEDKSRLKLVNCKISLISQTEVEIKSKSAEHLFGENGDHGIWKFPSFISKTYLQSKTYDILKNSTYTLKFEIIASTGENLSEINCYDIPLSKNTCLDDSVSALLEDLRSLLNTDKGYDVKFRVEDLIIPANKAILRARSPVFNAMFELDMLENQTGIIEILDVKADTLNLLLEFVYTGSMKELNFVKAMELLVAADKYQIPSFSKKCSIFLESKLSVENVCDVYTCADLINIVSLKLSALNFIVRNSKTIILSDIWSDWTEKHVTLANEILFELARESLQ